MSTEDKAERKVISWRLERLSESQRRTINNWADHQDNIQQSITNIVLHHIKRFGADTDIMEFDVQQVLHAESLAFSSPIHYTSPREVLSKVAPVPVNEIPAATQEETHSSTQDVIQENTQNEYVEEENKVTPPVTEQKTSNDSFEVPQNEGKTDAIKGMYSDAQRLFNEPPQK